MSAKEQLVYYVGALQFCYTYLGNNLSTLEMGFDFCANLFGRYLARYLALFLVRPDPMDLHMSFKSVVIRKPTVTNCTHVRAFL